MKNIKNFIKNNKALSILLFTLLIVAFIIAASYVSNSNNILSNSESSIINYEDDYYWISTDDYFYDEKKDLIISNTAYAFKFLDNNKCYIATINGDTIYDNNQVYYKFKKYKSALIEKQGVWLSNLEECSYQINDNHIYINPLNDDATLFNGEIFKDKDKIEIIWNGDNRKTTYCNIKIENNILFSYTFFLEYDDIYEYEVFDYDFDSHIRKPDDGIDYGIRIDEIIKPILLEQNLDISVDEFWSFNSTMLNSDSLEYNAFFSGSLYSYGSYSKIGLRSPGIEQARGKVLKLYAPRRKLTREEVIEKISNETNITYENIVVPDTIKYLENATIYITSMDVLRDYIY